MVVYLKLLFVIEALGNQNLDVHTEVPLRGTGWFNYPQSGIQMVYIYIVENTLDELW